MPLITRSNSDSCIYSRKISLLGKNIAKQAHHPKDIINTTTSPKTFVYVHDWIKYWKEYHDNVLYWKPLFTQTSNALGHFQKIHKKWDTLCKRQQETTDLLEATRKQLQVVKNSSKIDFFENERLENKIMVLEKKQREDFFTPEIKQQLAQNTTRFLEWKSQDSVETIYRNFKQWKTLESEWRESFINLFHNISPEHPKYHYYFSGIYHEDLEKVRLIIRDEWFLHPDPLDFNNLSEISLTPSENNIINLEQLMEAAGKKQIDNEYDSDEDIYKRTSLFRQNKTPDDIPLFKARLKLISEMSSSLDNYNKIVSKYWWGSWLFQNTIFVLMASTSLLSSLCALIYSNMLPIVSVFLVLFLFFQTGMSFFPKYSGFVVHSSAKEMHTLYFNRLQWFHPLVNMMNYWYNNHRDILFTWKKDTFIGYVMFRNRILETSALLCLTILFTSCNITLSSVIIMYWNWIYARCSGLLIFKPYQDWMYRIKKDGLNKQD